MSKISELFTSAETRKIKAEAIKKATENKLEQIRQQKITEEKARKKEYLRKKKRI